MLPRHHSANVPSAPSSPGYDYAEDFSRFMTEFRTAVSETLNGVHISAGRARPVPVGINGLGATKRPTTSAGAIMGFSFTNYDTSTTANITIYLYDGPDNNAPKLFEVTLAPGESTRDWFEGGIHIGDQGLYVTATGGNAGTFSGMVFLSGAR